jgi:outer membrane lipoprotein SlyB
MKKLFVGLTAVFAFAAASGAAMADDYYADDGYRYESRYDGDRYESRRYDDRYDNDRVYYRERERSSSAPVVGAIIGGLIGNQFGHGDGRTAATVAGAALGYAAGRDSDRHGGYYDSRYYGGSYHYDRPYYSYAPSSYYYAPRPYYPAYGYGYYGYRPGWSVSIGYRPYRHGGYRGHGHRHRRWH